MNDDAVYAIWCWIINANNGGGTDVDDLIEVLASHGVGCPDALKDEWA